jgi:DNA-binding IclR family transcriptional regulator
MIQSVDRSIRILKALAGGPGRLGVSELSDRLGLAKATVHGLLRTLHEHGLVEQHADSDKYQLGPLLLQLSNRYLDLSELRSRSLAWSEALASRADEAVRVGAFHGDGMLVVHHVFRPDSSLQILEVGSLLPLHATALGKAVLAYLDDDVQADLVGDEPPRLTGRTLATLSALEKDLGAVRERGYALEREEAVIGEAGLAAAIFDRRDEAIGAIGVAGPRERLVGRSRERALATAVIEAARGISRDLGASRWPAVARSPASPERRNAPPSRHKQ